MKLKVELHQGAVAGLASTDGVEVSAWTPPRCPIRASSETGAPS
jgi:hypothetical protein